MVVVVVEGVPPDQPGGGAGAGRAQAVDVAAGVGGVVLEGPGGVARGEPPADAGETGAIVTEAGLVENQVFGGVGVGRAPAGLAGGVHLVPVKTAPGGLDPVIVVGDDRARGPRGQSSDHRGGNPVAVPHIQAGGGHPDHGPGVEFGAVDLIDKLGQVLLGVVLGVGQAGVSNVGVINGIAGRGTVIVNSPVRRPGKVDHLLRPLDDLPAAERSPGLARPGPGFRKEQGGEKQEEGRAENPAQLAVPVKVHRHLIPDGAFAELFRDHRPGKNNTLPGYQNPGEKRTAARTGGPGGGQVELESRTALSTARHPISASSASRPGPRGPRRIPASPSSSRP